MFHPQNPTLMAKIYTQAPLPFMGQKRRWNKDFKAALLKDFGDCHTFIDLFGGSGLLSHFTHTVRPDATIIYNDYDNYSQRLAAIPTTNALLSELRELLKDYPDLKRIEEPMRSKVISKIAEYDQRGWLDYITLSASIVFSGRYVTSLAEIQKDTLYNTLRQSDYTAEGYLDGLTVVHEDYRRLFNRYRQQDGVCFLIDPPYLSTQATTYTGYWKLRDYLDVLHTLHGTNYFYFTSEKSSILELCEWLDDEYQTGNPFKGATRIDYATHLNYAAGFIDIMLYKHQPTERRDAA